MCEAIGAFCLIDDAVGYVKEGLESRVLETAILFGNYGWNREEATLSEVEGRYVRCVDWSAVDCRLEELVGED